MPWCSSTPRRTSCPAASVKAVIATAEAADHRGFAVALGGDPISSVITAAPGSSEGIGITAAILIMLLAFGSVVAMGLPIITALFGLGIGIALLELVTHLLVVPTFAPEMAAMIGIGVGIDYALFIATRYRQGLFEGRGPRDAVVVSIMTSGRSVLFAGGTVVISLFGLFLIGQAYMIGLATACIAAVLMVLLAALTLLPALLGFAGEAIDRLHLPGLLQSGGPPSARRVLVSAGAASFSGGPGSPAPWPPWSLVAPGPPALQHAAGLHRCRQRSTVAHHPPGLRPTGPRIRAGVQRPAGGGGGHARARGQRHRASICVRPSPDTPGVAYVVPPQFNARQTGAVLVAYPTTSPQAARHGDAGAHPAHRRDPAGGRPGPASTPRSEVRRRGASTPPPSSAAVSLSSSAAVLVLSFLFLMAVFRSVVLPLKAVVMNLLSVGAAYGVMVAVFEWGWLGSLIGIGQTGPIDPWIPVTMFTILFGLSMDYEVFLLSRIREEWLRTGDNSLAVADGLAVTGRIITAAAAIMFCVFASFVINDPLHILKVFGLGLAVAVAVDVTLVRMVLVPSLMELLGPVTGGCRAWLRRVVPTLGAEGAPPPVPAPAS